MYGKSSVSRAGAVVGKRVIGVSILILVAAIAIGCAPITKVTKTSNEQYTVRLKSYEEVEIHDGEPTAHLFVEIATIEAEGKRGFASKTKNKEALKKEAYELGADAVMNVKCSPTTKFQSARCKGTAIRYIYGGA